MHPALRLPFHCNAAALQSDLAALLAQPAPAPTAELWTPHFNTAYFEGDWSGIVLRGPRDARNLFTGANTSLDGYEDSPLLARCPNLAAALAQFHCPLRTVRLLRLRAGSIIREHCDPDLGLAQGEARIHIPIHTNPQVEFYLHNERILMNEGECWFLALEGPHRVQNLGPTDRIHLVIDCVANLWLRGVLEAADRDPASRPPAIESSAGTFAAFRQRVLADPTLQAQLRDIPDTAAFTAATVALGAATGFTFTLDDVRSGLRAAQRARMEKLRA